MAVRNFEWSVKSVTIASGQTASGEIDIEDFLFAAIEFPSAMTGAAVTITGSDQSGGTFVPLHDSSGAISVTVAASTMILVSADVLAARFIKLVSGSAEGADRALKVHLKR